MRQQGVVLQYRVNAGFGFIKTPSGQSLFFHIKQVRDGFLLESGDFVSFTVGQSTREAGKSECFDVELMERASTAVRQ